MLRAIQADITQLNVDAIVNAANSSRVGDAKLAALAAEADAKIGGVLVNV